MAASLLKSGKFATALETRLAVLIEAKVSKKSQLCNVATDELTLLIQEQTVFMPLFQRVLLAALFLEIRLLTRQLKL